MALTLIPTNPAELQNEDRQRSIQDEEEPAMDRSIRWNLVAWPGLLLILFAVAILAACGDDDNAGKNATTATGLGATSTTVSSNAPASQTAVVTTAASATATTSSASTLDGTWSGTWKSSATSDNGTVRIEWKQSGQQLSGTIAVTNTPCVANGTITGTVSGTDITFGAVQGATTIAYTGKVSGKSIAGTYRAGPSCGNAIGEWSAAKGS